MFNKNGFSALFLLVFSGLQGMHSSTSIPGSSRKKQVVENPFSDGSGSDSDSDSAPSSHPIWQFAKEQREQASTPTKKDKDVVQEVIVAPRASQEVMKFPRTVFVGFKALAEKLISEEQAGVQAAYYRFTLWDVAQKMVERQRAGVPVQVLVNYDMLPHSAWQKNNQTGRWERTKREKGDFISPLRLVKRHGATVYRTNPQSCGEGMCHMHNKFMIFDKNIGGKALVWTGSWNCTAQAEENNDENVVILDDLEAVKSFKDKFLELRRKCVQISDAELKLEGSKDSEAGSRNTRIKNGIPDSALV